MEKAHFEALITRMAVAGSVSITGSIKGDPAKGRAMAVVFTVSSNSGLGYISDFSELTMPTDVSMSSNGFTEILYEIDVEDA